jgi:hypothetical protein
MATTTTLSGTITAGQNRLVLAAFTNPATTFGATTLLRFATGEVCLVTDASLSPTLSVVRGYAGSAAAAHTTLEGVVYGLDTDAAFVSPVPRTFVQPNLTMQAQEITATGATGTTAATVTPASYAFLNATGVSGTGINLPVPTVGMYYLVRNNGTGALLVYSVGATINGTTGTTAVTITATGSLGGAYACATAGAWRTVPNAT